MGEQHSIRTGEELPVAVDRVIGLSGIVTVKAAHARLKNLMKAKTQT